MKRQILAAIAGFANFAFGAVRCEFYTGGAASWIQTGDVWRSGAIDSSMTPEGAGDRPRKPHPLHPFTFPTRNLV